MLVMTGGVMGRQWTEEDYDRTTRQIERWISEANRMWASAQNSIHRVKEIQDKLIEQKRTLGRTPRVALWLEG
jgi:hypothetical protein